MVGSGVTVENIAHLVEGTHAAELHASASIRETKTATAIRMGDGDDNTHIVTQRNIVEALARCVHEDAL